MRATASRAHPHAIKTSCALLGFTRARLYSRCCPSAGRDFSFYFFPPTCFVVSENVWEHTLCSPSGGLVGGKQMWIEISCYCELLLKNTQRIKWEPCAGMLSSSQTLAEESPICAHVHPRSTSRLCSCAHSLSGKVSLLGIYCVMLRKDNGCGKMWC